MSVFVRKSLSRCELWLLETHFPHVIPSASTHPHLCLFGMYLFISPHQLCPKSVNHVCIGPFGTKARWKKKWSMQSTIVCSFTTIEHIYISFHRHKQTQTHTHTRTQTTHKTHKHNIYSTEKAAVVFYVWNPKNSLWMQMQAAHLLHMQSRVLELCRANYYRDPQLPCRHPNNAKAVTSQAVAYSVGTELFWCLWLK